MKHLVAVGAYDRGKLMDKAVFLDFVVEIVRRNDEEPGFSRSCPRRWVVERTFGWPTRWRRLVRDYEQRLSHSEAMIMSTWEASSAQDQPLDPFSNGL